MTVTKKLIGRLPILLGEYDSTKTYSKKQRVTLYGSEFESKIDNNDTVPATVSGTTMTVNNTNWQIVSNGTEAFLAGEKLKIINLVDNPEFVATETDVDGRLLSSVDHKGNKTIYGDANIKGNLNVDNGIKVKGVDVNDGLKYKQDKEDGKGLVDVEFAKRVKITNDIEDRLELKLDSDTRIISYRDSDGKLHENAGLDTTDINATSVNVGDLKLKNKNDLKTVLKEEHFIGNFDWSDDKFVELPKPNVAAKINLIVDHLATAKGQNIKGYMEYWDKLGNYFKKPIILNAQGASSIQWWIKNQTIDINDGSTIKFGNWRPFDSFHLKKFYIDSFRGQCIVGYWLTEQVYKTRPLGQQRPNDYLKTGSTTTNGSGTFASDFETGALFHPDGFPVMTYLNGALQGLYTFCIKKDRSNYEMNKKNHLQIHLDGIIGSATLWSGVINYTQFEIRNPKINKDIDGKKYDGDNPKEPSADFQDTKDAITRISNAYNAMKDNPTKESFESYFNVPFYIDKVLISNAIWDQDGFWKNWQWHTWNGKIWCPTLYDLDSIFGMRPDGMSIVPAGEKCTIEQHPTAWTNTNTVLGLNSQNGDLLWKLYSTEIKARYKELRDNGVFTTDNIVGLLRKWLNMCGYDNIKTDLEECCAYNGVPQTPSYRDGSKTYEKKPTTEGFYNSVPRVKAWLDEHFAYLDEVFEYNVNSASNK